MDDCHICDSTTDTFGTGRVLGKHDIAYLRCSRCGFVQTEKPYWLDEAYSDAIAASDLGLISRNVRLAETTASLIRLFFNQDERFLDYGGGYGMFVRLMRDRGFDFYRDDPLCDNLFARGFDRSDGGPFEMVTAFEVFEHLPDPIADVRRMLELSENVLFSTTLLPPSNPGPGEWWYYTLDTGQHVSIYTSASLRALAARLGVQVASSRELHLLTNNQRAIKWFNGAARQKTTRLLALTQRKRRSLLPLDYERLTGRQPN